MKERSKMTTKKGAENGKKNKRQFSTESLKARAEGQEAERENRESVTKKTQFNRQREIDLQLTHPWRASNVAIAVPKLPPPNTATW